MVGTAGFEPTTSASRTLRATKLRHVPSGAESLARRREPDSGQTETEDRAARNSWAVNGFTRYVLAPARRARNTSA